MQSGVTMEWGFNLKISCIFINIFLSRFVIFCKKKKKKIWLNAAKASEKYKADWKNYIVCA